MNLTSRGRPRLSTVLGIVCVLVLVISGALWWVAQASGTKVVAYFDKAVGLYPDSTVRVLGIEVGRVKSIAPQGDVVRVDMNVDSGVDIPAGAKAVVVAPSLVSDRYVQLTPAYTSGPKMASGAVIAKEHTVTPAEMDDLYRNANALSQALGPDGANKNGALSSMLNTAAGNLHGNGDNLNVTLKRLGELSATLSDSKGDMFATVDNLNKFTATLAQSDGQIKDFSGRMADVTGYMASERQQMGASLHSLASALSEVEGFVRDNRGNLSSNVHNLTGVTQQLVDQRKAAGEVLDIAPLAMSNFINSYDAASGSIAVRGAMNELSLPPVLMVCKLLEHGAPRPVPPEVTQTCTRLAPYLDGRLKLPSVNEALAALQRGQLPPLPLPVADMMKQGDNLPLPAGGGR